MFHHSWWWNRKFWCCFSPCLWLLKAKFQKNFHRGWCASFFPSQWPRCWDLDWWSSTFYELRTSHNRHEVMSVIENWETFAQQWGAVFLLEIFILNSQSCHAHPSPRGVMRTSLRKMTSCAALRAVTVLWDPRGETGNLSGSMHQWTGDFGRFEGVPTL